MTEDERIGMWCRGRVDGMGDPCPVGSYIGIVYKDATGARHHISISTGHAENLIAEIQAALKPAPEPRKPFPPGTRVTPAT